MRKLMMCVAVGVILIGCHKSSNNPPSPTARTVAPPKQLAHELVVAVKDKAPDKVKTLLDAGADPTMAVDNQTSAIDSAAVEIDRSNNAGRLALDWSGKEEQILFLMTSNIRRRRAAIHLEGPISVNAEYGGVGSSGIKLVADIIIHDNNGDHMLLLSSFETTTKNINRTNLNQVAGVFPIVLGHKYRLDCTQYKDEGCEVDYIEQLDNNSATPMSVPVGVVLPSTAHILNANNSKAGR